MLVLSQSSRSSNVLTDFKHIILYIFASFKNFMQVAEVIFEHHHHEHHHHFIMNIMNWTNFSDELLDIDSYLAVVLGPKQLSLNWLLPLTTVYAVIFITGLVGNACTCLVIARNPYMQTATNCYLFNLAVADMLTLLCGKCIISFVTYTFLIYFIAITHLYSVLSLL